MFKNKKKFKRWLLIPAVLLFIMLFFLYGPIRSVRLLFINTAIHTTRFQKLPTLFYTENYINKVIGKIEPEENPRSDDSVLSHNWDDGISFTEIKGDHFKGFLIKNMFYTPSTST